MVFVFGLLFWAIVGVFAKDFDLSCEVSVCILVRKSAVLLFFKSSTLMKLSWSLFIVLPLL